MVSYPLPTLGRGTPAPGALLSTEGNLRNGEFVKNTSVLLPLRESIKPGESHYIHKDTSLLFPLIILPGEAADVAPDVSICFHERSRRLGAFGRRYLQSASYELGRLPGAGDTRFVSLSRSRCLMPT